MQADRVLVQLLRSTSDQAVSLEVLGDIAVETAGGSLLSEESKRQGLGSHPLRDSSVDIWKTLRNWVDAIDFGHITPANTVFRLYSSRPIVSPLIRLLAGVRTPEDAHAALDAVRAHFGIVIAKDGGVHMGRSVAVALRPHLETIFRTSLGTLSELLISFDIEEGSGVPSEDLRRQIAGQIGIPTDSGEQVLEYLIGWVKRRIDICIDHGYPARVEREDFKSAVDSAVRWADQRRVLRSVTVHPTLSQTHRHLESSIYVEQLGIVGLSYDDQLRAITEYIQAEASRTEWSDRGDVFEKDFEEFENVLVRAWRARKSRGDILHREHSDEDRGALLYWDCNQYRAKLGQFDIPDHFCPGSFHRLADLPNDGPQIGWHPHYKRLLRRVRAVAQDASQSAFTAEVASSTNAPTKRRGERNK